MMKITQKGDLYFVEDTGADRVIGRFKDKPSAEQFARQKTHEMQDYFRNTRVNMTVNSEEQLEARI